MLRQELTISLAMAMPLVICVLAGAQPTTRPLSYRVESATYLGGSEYDDLREVIIDKDGSVLLGGQTVSADMPVTAGVLQKTYGGEPAGTGHPGVFGGDCWVGRLSGDLKQILTLTYFGGSKQERDVYGMGLDSKGDIVITTTSRSADIPTTDGCFQKKYAGDEADVVAAKLSADLKTIRWCTYLGGRGNETPRGGLAIDQADNVVIVGTTASPDFPTTAGTLQPLWKKPYSAFVTKLKADGSGLIWSTFLGSGNNNGIMGVRVDAKGTIYVAGHTDAADFPVTPSVAQDRHGGASDCFVASLAPDASKLIYCTLLGGRGNEFAEHRLALLQDGSTILTGVTGSADFPTTPAAFQRQLKGKTNGFVTKLSPGGKQFVGSTLLGGSEGEFFLMPTTDAAGNILVVGHTRSPDFPVTANALQTKPGGGDDGAFAILSPDGSKLLYATYLGGKGEDLIRSLAIDKDGSVYLIGKTESDDFPVTKGDAQVQRKGGLDAFVVKLVPAP